MTTFQKISLGLNRPLPPEVKEDIARSCARGLIALALFGAMLVLVPVSSSMSFFIVGAISLCIGLLVKLTHAVWPNFFKFEERKQKISTWYGMLDRSQRLYLNVPLFGLFAGYIAVVDKNVLPPVLWMITVYCIGIAIHDVLRVYGAMTNTVLGKGIIGVGFLAGSTLAFSFSNFILGELTEGSPFLFPHTLTFLSIGMIPILFLLLGFIYLVFTILIIPFTFMLFTLQKHLPLLSKWLFAKDFIRPGRQWIIATLLFQVLFYMVLIPMVSKLSIHFLELRQKQIASVISKSLYYFDMYPATICSLGRDHRVSSMGDETYMVAQSTGDKITFLPARKCAAK